MTGRTNGRGRQRGELAGESFRESLWNAAGGRKKWRGGMGRKEENIVSVNRGAELYIRERSHLAICQADANLGGTCAGARWKFSVKKLFSHPLYADNELETLISLDKFVSRLKYFTDRWIASLFRKWFLSSPNTNPIVRLYRITISTKLRWCFFKRRMLVTCSYFFATRSILPWKRRTLSACFSAEFD